MECRVQGFGLGVKEGLVITDGKKAEGLSEDRLSEGL